MYVIDRVYKPPLQETSTENQNVLPKKGKLSTPTDRDPDIALEEDGFPIL